MVKKNARPASTPVSVPAVKAAPAKVAKAPPAASPSLGPPVKKTTPPKLKTEETAPPPPVNAKIPKGDKAFKDFVMQDIYAQTLMEPGRVLGVKVPVGGSNQNTITSTSITRFKMVVNASGFAAALVGWVTNGTHYKCGFIPTALGTVDPSGTKFNTIAMLNKTASTGAAPVFAYGATGSPLVEVSYSIGSIGAVAARVVSAGLSVQSQASSLDNKGSITMTIVPPTFFDEFGGDITLVSADDIRSTPGCWMGALSKVDGVHALWKPFDNRSAEFNNSIADDTGLLPFYDTACVGGGYAMIVMVEGATPSTELLCSLVLNEEGLVNRQYANANGVSLGLDDPVGYAEVQNVFASVVPVGPGVGSTLMAYNQAEYDSSSHDRFPRTMSMLLCRPVRSAKLKSDTALRQRDDVFPHDGPVILKKSKFKNILSSATQYASMFGRLATEVLPIVSKFL